MASKHSFLTTHHFVQDSQSREGLSGLPGSHAHLCSCGEKSLDLLSHPEGTQGKRINPTTKSAVLFPIKGKWVLGN